MPKNSDDLRVLVIGPTEPDTFADNVHDTLVSMGIDARLAGPARTALGPRRVRNLLSVTAQYMPAVDERQQAHLVESARVMQPDLVISLEGHLRPAIVEGLRAYSQAVVLWFPDHVANLGRHEMLMNPYTRFYFKNEALVRQLRDITGLPAVYLPEAANPHWHRPLVEYGTRREIVVAGNLHPTRVLLLERMIRDQIPLVIYGSPLPGWIKSPDVVSCHTGRFVAREEKARVFRSARGILNNLHPAEFAGSNCRLFEATASGAVVLSEQRAGMADLFELGREVLDFCDYERLLELCRNLLADVSFGVQIADAAALRSRRDHTYEHRIRAILDDLGLS